MPRGSRSFLLNLGLESSARVGDKLGSSSKGTGMHFAINYSKSFATRI